MRSAVRTIRDMLGPLGRQVELEEVELPDSDLPASNSILINGIPLEELLGAAVVETPCVSCCEILGNEVSCRALEFRDGVIEYIPAELIVKAAMNAIGKEESDRV